MNNPEKENKLKFWFTALALLITAGIFFLDTLLPLGVADGVLYVAVVLIGLRLRSKTFVLYGALAGSILTLLGFFVSPPGGEFWKVITNRALAIITIWMTTVLSLWQIRVGKLVSQYQEELEKRVMERTSQLDETNELLRKESEFVELHKDIAVASNEPSAIESTLTYCLKRICSHTGWPVGHLYLTAERGSNRLIPTSIWHLEDPDLFKTFQEITEATPLNTGVGLPGRVMASGKPGWIIDVSKDPNFPRANQARDIGVKAGFAFPVLVGKEIVGVMEFFSSHAAEPDRKMLDIMEQIGTQLGRVIERKRAEEDQQRLLDSLKERVKELTALYGVANLVSTSKSMKEILQKAGSYIVTGMQFPELTRVKVTFQGETFYSKPFAETPWMISGKIARNGKPQGSLEVYYAQSPAPGNDNPFLPEERDMIAGLAHLLSIASERLRAEEEIKLSREQLRSLYHRLELVREEERTRMSREIHDELAQVLSAVKMEVSLLDSKLNKSDPPLCDYTQMMLKLIDNTIQAGKKLVQDLRPPLLDDLGLPEAIEWQAKEFEKKTGVTCELELDKKNFELDKDRSTTLFRIFQETLTNITRHANADKLHVKLYGREGAIVLQVKDNGIGITQDQISNLKSLGLLGMRERALVWGGKVDIRGEPNKGTTVTINLNRDFS